LEITSTKDNLKLGSLRNMLLIHILLQVEERAVGLVKGLGFVSLIFEN
jgi:hypothetical protein